jgi:hypothetical protein
VAALSHKLPGRLIGLFDLTLYSRRLARMSGSFPNTC